MANDKAVAKRIEDALNAEMARKSANASAAALPAINIPCIAAAVVEYGVCKFTHGDDCETKLAKAILACF